MRIGYVTEIIAKVDGIPPHKFLFCVVILIIVAILLSGCSTRLFRHELQYQGNKIVLSTLNDLEGKSVMTQFLKEYQQTADFREVVSDIAASDRDKWFETKIGQGVLGGGLFGGGGLLTFVLYYLKRHLDNSKVKADSTVVQA